MCESVKIKQKSLGRISGCINLYVGAFNDDLQIFEMKSNLFIKSYRRSVNKYVKYRKRNERINRMTTFVKVKKLEYKDEH